MIQSLDSVASQLHVVLRQTGHRIVLAESCTAGLVAASLARLPGISEFLTGSAVVYQLETKHEWLQVDRQSLDDPGPVSRMVSEQMATGVLRTTPHATLGLSVTGHLGPGAPSEQDGTAWTTLAVRSTSEIRIMYSQLLQLDTVTASENEVELRRQRQFAAAQLVMERCVRHLKDQSHNSTSSQ